jgi:hypothetical protein
VRTIQASLILSTGMKNETAKNAAKCVDAALMVPQKTSSYLRVT